jgi:hypothetical protein
MVASPSPIKKFVLTPIALSVTAFVALTLPLAAFGSKPMTINLQKEPIFEGQLRDFAVPYLSLASAVSLGVGVASVAVTGWRLSSRKSSQFEAELAGMAQNLKEKEAQLQELKLSELRLEASGLSAFLNEEVSPEQVLKTPDASLDDKPVVQPLVITAHPFEAQPVALQQVTVQAAVRQFASAQIFLGYAQAKAAVKPSTTPNSPTPLEVEQLHNQLQQIMAEMVTVKKALSTHPIAVTSEAQVPTHVHTSLQVAKSWSVNNIGSGCLLG